MISSQCVICPLHVNQTLTLLSTFRNTTWKLLDKSEYVLTQVFLFSVTFLCKSIIILNLNVAFDFILSIERFKDPGLTKRFKVQFYSFPYTTISTSTTSNLPIPFRVLLLFYFLHRIYFNLCFIPRCYNKFRYLLTFTFTFLNNHNSP